MRKTLLYHVFPVKGNDVWIKNINWLKEYSNDFKIFDRLIISVCIEKNSKDDYERLVGKHYDLGQRDLVTHTDEDYIKSFFPKDADIQFYENDPTIGEIYTFRDMLEKVYSLEDEMTFYAHTKGVSYFKTVKPILTWTESMYKFNLKYVDKLDEILKKYSTAGCFKITNFEHWDLRDKNTKKNWPQTADRLKYAGWHYSGTFFWFNNKKLFSNDNWNQVDGLHDNPHRHGVEMYFGHVFEQASAFEIITSNQKHLYQQKIWWFIKKNEKKLINPWLT